MLTEWEDGILLADLPDEPELSSEFAEIFSRLEAPRRGGGGGSGGGGVGGREQSGKGRASDDAPNSAPHLVLNFRMVAHLNSSHLAQLLRMRKKVEELGRTLILCSLRDDLWSVMMLTGLDKVFRFAADPMTALASVQIEGARNDEE